MCSGRHEEHVRLLPDRLRPRPKSRCRAVPRPCSLKVENEGPNIGVPSWGAGKRMARSTTWVRKFLPLKHLASRADCVLHAHESVATAHKTASIPHFRQCACRAAGSLPRGRACGRTVHHTHVWTGRSATRSTRSRVSAGRSPLCDHHVTKTLRSVL